MSACVTVFYLMRVFLYTVAPQAGIVIAQEAGGFVTGSKDAPHDGVVTQAILTGRRYLVIRGVAGTAVRRVNRDLTQNLLVYPIHPSIHPYRRKAASTCKSA